jgi:predicted ATPase
MNIYIVERRSFVPEQFPSITLHPDKWDDFGFKTTFFATFWESEVRSVDLLDVKIMRIGMAGETYTPLLGSFNEDALPEDCASLGANYDYYKRVKSLGEKLSQSIFRSMRDVAFDSDRRSMVESEPAYQSSLLRLRPARDALNRMILESAKSSETASESPRSAGEAEAAPDRTDEVPQQAKILENDADEIALVDAAESPTDRETLVGALRILFSPLKRADRHFIPERIDFDFAGPPELPSNLIALVGPNGTGKTTLLAELALTMFFGSAIPDGQPAGSLDIPSGAVRDVIFISYSAYDSFEIPQGQELGEDARDDLARQGYVYVGLRKLESDELADGRNREHRLKSIQELDDEFASNVHRLSDDLAPKFDRQNRMVLFASALRTLILDPSFAAIIEVRKKASDGEVIREVQRLFPSMSTGHKAILNIVASLCLRLNRNSLVMMDEPEAHLHPPLVAALLKIVRNLLGAFDAHAIVATHSPIVVQETLGQHVLLFERKHDSTTWASSPRQTFGENVAALTREVFGLPAAMTDFIGVLEERLAEERLQVRQ